MKKNKKRLIFVLSIFLIFVIILSGIMYFSWTVLKKSITISGYKELTNAEILNAIKKQEPQTIRVSPYSKEEVRETISCQEIIFPPTCKTKSTGNWKNTGYYYSGGVETSQGYIIIATTKGDIVQVETKVENILK